MMYIRTLANNEDNVKQNGGIFSKRLDNISTFPIGRNSNIEIKITDNTIINNFILKFNILYMSNMLS